MSWVHTDNKTGTGVYNACTFEPQNKLESLHKDDTEARERVITDALNKAILYKITPVLLSGKPMFLRLSYKPEVVDRIDLAGREYRCYGILAYTILSDAEVGDYVWGDFDSSVPYPKTEFKIGTGAKFKKEYIQQWDTTWALWKRVE